MKKLGTVEDITMENGKCNFYEWDEEGFVLPSEYTLNDKSDLSNALEVFYLAGGYDFFNVVEPQYYAANWLNFIGTLYSEIEDGKYKSFGKHFSIPLSKEQRTELFERGVPSVFVKDI